MKNKIMLGLAVVILIGVIIMVAVGFNVDLNYREYNLISVNIGKEFSVNDVKNIANEVFGKSKVEVQKAGIFVDNAAIKVSETNITEEQKELLNAKINEKYGIENKTSDMQINFVPRFRLLDIAKPYIIPLIAATALILVYMAVRFRKIGIAKVLYQSIVLTALAEFLYFSILAITRYPINGLTMPVAIILYITIITVLTGMFEKQLKTEN